MRDELGTLVEILRHEKGDFGTVSREFNYVSVVRFDPCSYCGGPGGTVDHIVPQGKGGRRSVMLNGTSSCGACNVKKSDRSLLHFLSIIKWEKEQDERAARKSHRGFFTDEQIAMMKQVAAGTI